MGPNSNSLSTQLYAPSWEEERGLLSRTAAGLFFITQVEMAEE